jgi:signal peptidase I
MTTVTRKRRPIVAALLSLLLPGLGQLYAGKGRAAVRWMAIALFLYLVVHWGLLPIDRMLLLPAGFWLMMGLVALAVAWQIWAIVDAFLSARRAGATALKQYQRWYVYTALAVLFLGPQFVVDTDRLKPLPAFSIPSNSMSPTLRVGDRVVASNNWFRDHPPARGDLAVHASARDPSAMFVKRIIGLPGDRVQYKEGGSASMIRWSSGRTSTTTMSWHSTTSAKAAAPISIGSSFPADRAT